MEDAQTQLPMMHVWPTGQTTPSLPQLLDEYLPQTWVDVVTPDEFVTTVKTLAVELALLQAPHWPSELSVEEVVESYAAYVQSC